jgi:hypothetical protein
MIQQLEKAFAEASKLPTDEQAAVAAWILAELDSERRWTELFAKSPEVLSELAEEAMKEYESGETQLLDPEKL